MDLRALALLENWFESARGPNGRGDWGDGEVDGSRAEDFCGDDDGAERANAPYSGSAKAAREVRSASTRSLRSNATSEAGENMTMDERGAVTAERCASALCSCIFLISCCFASCLTESWGINSANEKKKHAHGSDKTNNRSANNTCRYFNV